VGVALYGKSRENVYSQKVGVAISNRSRVDTVSWTATKFWGKKQLVEIRLPAKFDAKKFSRSRDSSG
jgi:hypothetical protein